MLRSKIRKKVSFINGDFDYVYCLHQPYRVIKETKITKWINFCNVYLKKYKEILSETEIRIYK